MWSFYILFLHSSAYFGAIKCTFAIEHTSREHPKAARIEEIDLLLMQGRQSQDSTIIPLDLEIEWTIRQRLKDNPDTKEEFKEEEEELKFEENDVPSNT